MMRLMKMRYKDFEFTSNPKELTVKYQNNISETALFGSDSSVQNVSRNACAVSAAGVFFGSGGIALVSRLEALYRDRRPGSLFLPNGACFSAYFGALSYEICADESAVSYRLEFKEDCRHVAAQYDFGFTYALRGENVFHISDRTGVSVENIIEINNLRGAFDLSEGDKVVLK